MKLLDRLITRELIGPFLFGLTAFSSVFFAGSYLLKITQWLMNGMPFWTAVQIFALYVPQVVVYTLPMATLLAVLLGIGRLSADSETTALFAGGISLYRLVVPVFLLGLLVSGASISLNELVAPRAAARNQALQQAVFNEESRSNRSFVLRDDATQCVISVGGMDVDTGALNNVTITKYADGVPFLVIFARRARWEGLNNGRRKLSWQLYDGRATAMNGSGTTTFAKSWTRDISKTPQELSLFQKKPEEMSFAELSRLVRHLKDYPDRPPDKIRQLNVDRWNKLALPLSSLVFAMLAAPLAIRPNRSSSSVGLGISMLLIFLYWIIWHYTSQLAVQGSIDAPVGVFTANVLGIVAAAVLLKRAAK